MKWAQSPSVISVWSSLVPRYQIESLCCWDFVQQSLNFLYGNVHGIISTLLFNFISGDKVQFLLSSIGSMAKLIFCNLIVLMLLWFKVDMEESHYNLITFVVTGGLALLWPNVVMIPYWIQFSILISHTRRQPYARISRMPLLAEGQLLQHSGIHLLSLMDYRGSLIAVFYIFGLSWH